MVLEVKSGEYGSNGENDKHPKTNTPQKKRKKEESGTEQGKVVVDGVRCG